MVALDVDGSILKQQPLFVAGLNAWLHPGSWPPRGPSTWGTGGPDPSQVARLQDIPEDINNQPPILQLDYKKHAYALCRFS